MTSSSEKGNRYVRRVLEYRLKEGFLIHKAERAAVFIGKSRFVTHRNDLWHVGDLAGLSAQRGLAIDQVTTSANRAAHRRKIERVLSKRFPAGSFPDNISMNLWSWGRTKERGYGFTFETYLGGKSWTEATFIDSSEVPA